MAIKMKTSILPTTLYVQRSSKRPNSFGPIKQTNEQNSCPQSYPEDTKDLNNLVRASGHRSSQLNLVNTATPQFTNATGTSHESRSLAPAAKFLVGCQGNEQASSASIPRQRHPISSPPRYAPSYDTNSVHSFKQSSNHQSLIRFIIIRSQFEPHSFSRDLLLFWIVRLHSPVASFQQRCPLSPLRIELFLVPSFSWLFFRRSFL